MPEAAGTAAVRPGRGAPAAAPVAAAAAAAAGGVWRGHRSGRCLMYLGWGRPPEAGNHPLGAGAGRMPLPRPAAGYGAHSQGPGGARAVADAGAGGEVVGDFDVTLPLSGKFLDQIDFWMTHGNLENRQQRTRIQNTFNAID